MQPCSSIRPAISGDVTACLAAGCGYSWVSPHGQRRDGRDPRQRLTLCVQSTQAYTGVRAAVSVSGPGPRTSLGETAASHAYNIYDLKYFTWIWQRMDDDGCRISWQLLLPARHGGGLDHRIGKLPAYFVGQRVL